jgi:thiamine-monophosphate kinase
MLHKKKTSEKELLLDFACMIAAKKTPTKGIVVGVGDDTAVLRPHHKEDLLVTADILVENRHFKRAWFTGYELGWRLAAVNLSDVASMGGRPLYGVLSLALPEGLSVKYVREIEQGVRDHLARYGAAIVGGNVSGIDSILVCDLTLIGACARGKAWRRTCRPGKDAIVVAGYLGDARAGVGILGKNARAGLALLGKRGRARVRTSSRAAGSLVQAYMCPAPRLDVAHLLAHGKSTRGGSDGGGRSGGGRGSDRTFATAVHGAIDVSDGFSTDLLHICEASGAGCEVDPRALPLSAALRAYCARARKNPFSTALHGGDDYALILAVDPKQASSVVVRIEKELRIPARIVGRFTRHKGRYELVQDGQRTRFSAGGWDHLSAR